MDFDSQTWNDYAEALAFAGNSLLAPMGQTGAVALDSAFWDAFPDFGSSAVAEAIADCRAYAADAQRFMAGGGCGTPSMTARTGYPDAAYRLGKSLG